MTVEWFECDSAELILMDYFDRKRSEVVRGSNLKVNPGVEMPVLREEPHRTRIERLMADRVVK